MHCFWAYFQYLIALLKIINFRMFPCIYILEPLLSHGMVYFCIKNILKKQSVYILYYYKQSVYIYYIYIYCSVIQSKANSCKQLAGLCKP